MGKTGPCCHCGVTSTPLWRNGPSDKPVLCNACGSRWRTKGSLTNYAPLHAREGFELEEPKVPKVKSISLKPKVQKLHKKKLRTVIDGEHEMQYCDQNYRKIVERDTNNRSCSDPTDSAVSYSESCAYFGTNDASDMTGSAQSNAREPLVPSKKRTFVTRPKTSPFEELTKELCSILHEQQSCNISECSEDDLLYETVLPMDSSEIGYGSVLIRHPYSKAIEESEASSLPLEKKVYMKCNTFLGSPSFPKNAESGVAEFSNSCTDKLKKSTAEMSSDTTKSSRNKDNVGLRKLALMKRPSDSQPQNYPELMGATKGPKRFCTFGDSSTVIIGKDVPNSSNAGRKLNNGIDNLVEYEVTCSNPRSFFESPQDSSSMQAPFQFTADSSDQDLLVDVPSSASFAEAELLYPFWKEKKIPNVSAVDSELAEREESRSSFSITNAKNV